MAFCLQLCKIQIEVDNKVQCFNLFCRKLVLRIFSIGSCRKGSCPCCKTHKILIGIGSEMICEAVRLAESQGMKAISLDALATNTPAHKIYERLGFEYRGKQHLYAENTGWTDFFFFEYKDE